MDRLRLNPVSQRHVTAGSCAGVWLIGCEPVDGTVRYCRECGGMGRVRSSWRRRFVHMPVGQHAVHLLVRVRRYECMACARSWTDDLTHMADEGRRLTDAAVWWAVAEVVLKSKSVLACARDLHCSWGVLNRAVLEKGADVLAADLRRLDGVEAIGVDGHVWRHTRTGGRYVTVIVDLTPRRHGLCFVKLGSAFCAVFFRSVGSGFSAGCAVSAAACLRCVGYLVMRACSLR